MNDFSPSSQPAGTPQRGFSLVEFAVVLALVGVMVAIGFKSQELMEQYKQSQFVTGVRLLQSNLSAYRTATGRWPGDCNRDGLMDHVFINTTELVGDAYDYAVPSSLTPAADASASYALGKVCPAATFEPFDKLNVPFNELKRGGQTPTGEPNRKSAIHTMGGFAFLGTFAINANQSNTESHFNALVLTDVPITAARRLATAVDGNDGTAANLNRVRRSDDLITFAPKWTATGETDDKRITVVLFFDRIPPQ